MACECVRVRVRAYAPSVCACVESRELPCENARSPRSFLARGRTHLSHVLTRPMMQGEQATATVPHNRTPRASWVEGSRSSFGAYQAPAGSWRQLPDEGADDTLAAGSAARQPIILSDAITMAVRLASATTAPVAAPKSHAARAPCRFRFGRFFPLPGASPLLLLGAVARYGSRCLFALHHWSCEHMTQVRAATREK